MSRLFVRHAPTRAPPLVPSACLATVSIAFPTAGRLLPLVSPLLFFLTRSSRWKESPFLQARNMPAPATAPVHPPALARLREVPALFQIQSALPHPHPLFLTHPLSLSDPLRLRNLLFSVPPPQTRNADDETRKVHETAAEHGLGPNPKERIISAEWDSSLIGRLSALHSSPICIK
ncbi:hypothetical protein ZWY2020_037899 [Hordeum vulgare]|nr:hypothetical protein ZWY2020_037899 [Hordeum vulgare]